MAKPRPSLPDAVMAAVKSVYPRFDKMHGPFIALLTEHIAKKHAKGERAFVKHRPLAVLAHGGEPHVRDTPGGRGHVIGGRDWYITPAGDVELDDWNHPYLPLPEETA